MGCHKSTGWTPEEGVGVTAKVIVSPGSHLYDDNTIYPAGSSLRLLHLLHLLQVHLSHQVRAHNGHICDSTQGFTVMPLTGQILLLQP